MNENPGPVRGRPDDELSEELRRRLQDAVSEIRPAPDALDRLRDAVPARRRRRRATMLTAAATVVVLAVATPMVRTMVISDQNTQNSGSDTQTLPFQNGEGADDDDDDAKGEDGGDTFGLGSVGGIAGSGGPRPSPSGQASPTPSTTLTTPPTSLFPSYLPGGVLLPTDLPSIASASPAPSATTAPPAPDCTVDDLEQGGGTHLGQAGSDGIAYGIVEIRNASRKDCSIGGPGNVLVASPPGNPPIQVSVKVHQKGDPAVRLPEVVAATTPLVLRPGATYEFQFAWQPTLGTGVNGSCTAGDNPPGPPPPVPALGYSLADGGVRLAEVQLTAACGGVVYRTDVYPTGAYPKAG